MSALLHIASFVVHHRPEAAAALDAALARLSGIELALRGDGRSVLLCEGDSETALLDRVEVLRALDGVIGVSLVYHHAEPCEALIREIADDHAP
ncbi:chaperone NapD [Rehaibacterium terrae]|uniref:Chaperone NapD n=1 Tax=Rehaibacterium terrae TaxID=1341696 RepID=A0A7W7XZ05_9GAMM|nr:chaperone NapD [Rehaibacterium terrae]MBB5015044.1 nitrate reductase NapD [Rehaibacterium terrae]